MASFNKVFLMGNLTRDPELKYLPSGTALCSFGMAVNEKYKSGDEWKEKVHFVDITAWGKSAEAVTHYLEKGSQVLIEGRLDYQTWEKDGQKRSKLEVVANNVQFLNSPGEKAIREKVSASKPPVDGIPF